MTEVECFPYEVGTGRNIANVLTEAVSIATARNMPVLFWWNLRLCKVAPGSAVPSDVDAWIAALPKSPWSLERGTMYLMRSGISVRFRSGQFVVVRNADECSRHQYRDYAISAAIQLATDLMAMGIAP